MNVSSSDHERFVSKVVWLMCSHCFVNFTAARYWGQLPLGVNFMCVFSCLLAGTCVVAAEIGPLFQWTDLEVDRSAHAVCACPCVHTQAIQPTGFQKITLLFLELSAQREHVWSVDLLCGLMGILYITALDLWPPVTSDGSLTVAWLSSGGDFLCVTQMEMVGFEAAVRTDSARRRLQRNSVQLFWTLRSQTTHSQSYCSRVTVRRENQRRRWRGGAELVGLRCCDSDELIWNHFIQFMTKS